MRLKEEQIVRLSEKIVADLEKGRLIMLKTDRKKALSAVMEVFRTDMKAEEDLEKEAELLLEKTLRAAGSLEPVDRHKMLKLIKAKLAKERKLVL